MKKLFSVLDDVEKLLTIYPALRDSDEKLMANIWWSYVAFNIGENASSRALLSMLSEGKLPSYESISRCRRKLQEECPNIRGEKWNDRHKRAETIKKKMPSYQCFGDEIV